ncbi:MAG: hypothetical protein JNM63_16630, partial [Spirochaetia bacterium]|nr:hypothetical protein [Spirochaetia bacterium]
MYPLYADGSGTNRIELVNLQLCTVNAIPAPKKSFVAVSARQKTPVTIFSGTMAGSGDCSIGSEGSALHIHSMVVRGRSAVAFQNGSGKMEVVNSYVENADQLFESRQNFSGMNFVASLADRRLLETSDSRWPSFLAVAGGERRTWTPVAEVKSLSGIVVSPEDNATGTERRFELTGNWNGGEWISPRAGAKAIWRPLIKKDGPYLVELWYSDDPNHDHATDASYRVVSASGEKKIVLSQRTNMRQLTPLGVFDFKAGWDGFVELDATKADGNLVTGCVRFIRAPDFVDGKSRALWIVSGKESFSNHIDLIPSTDEGKLVQVKDKDGAQAWTLQPGKATGRFVYVKLSDESFGKGKVPSVIFLVSYFDEGDAKVNLNYDSLDEAKSGAYKSVLLFQLENTKTWKTARVAVADARFGGRCNGSDFRIGFPKDTPLLINAVAVIQNKTTP